MSIRRRLGLLLGLLLVSMAHPDPARAAADYRVWLHAAGPVLDFQDGDVAFSASSTIPLSGWEHRRVAGVSMFEEAFRRVPGHKRVVWIRLRFDRSALGPGPQAFTTDHTYDRMIVYLDGIDIYRTFTRSNDRQFNWNHPRIVEFPEKLLRPGGNELAIRIDTGVNYDLRLGSARIGPFEVAQAWYARLNFWRVEGTLAVDCLLLVLTAGVLLFWLVRPKEKEFGWLALVGILWMFRNLHYFVSAPPFDPQLFWELTIHSMFALMIALYGFAATFLDIPNRNRTMAWFAAAGIGIALLRVFEVSGNASDVTRDLLSYLLTIPLAGIVMTILASRYLAEPRIENLIMLLALSIAIGFSIHDLGQQFQWWRGTTVNLQPYSSVIVFSAFAFALGRRVLVALDTVENLNVILAGRVAEATARLEQSEAARRKMEVESALELERERIMREMHDGIGSNLITALGVAERKRASPETIAILRRSITDLKIAVDSLEPVEGDVVALLANLRHRLEPELEQAGLSFVWDVEESPPLDWLDAVGALHVLRIFQEAIGNIIAHARTSRIAVNCAPSARDGRAGVEIAIADRGCGFDPQAPSPGKGIANMRSRARSLNGEFRCTSSAGKGTRLSLWLPQVLAQVQPD